MDHCDVPVLGLVVDKLPSLRTGEGLGPEKLSYAQQFPKTKMEERRQLEIHIYLHSAWPEHVH